MKYNTSTQNDEWFDKSNSRAFLLVCAVRARDVL